MSGVKRIAVAKITMETDRRKGSVVPGLSAERLAKTTVKDYPDKKVGKPRPIFKKK